MTNEFIQSADSRETSVELMEAIWQASGGNEARAVDIWENGPNNAELTAIVAIVTGNGRTATTDYCWGACGETWESALA